MCVCFFFVFQTDSSSIISSVSLSLSPSCLLSVRSSVRSIYRSIDGSINRSSPPYHKDILLFLVFYLYIYFEYSLIYLFNFAKFFRDFLFLPVWRRIYEFNRSFCVFFSLHSLKIHLFCLENTFNFLLLILSSKDRPALTSMYINSQVI